MDGDGYPDILTSAPYELNPPYIGIEVGSASIFSGKDGTLLRKHWGPAMGDEYGYASTLLGDLNADGCAEYVIHARSRGTGGSGSPYNDIIDGKTGNTYIGNQRPMLPGSTAIYQLGTLGDVDGDGFPDLYACLSSSSRIISGRGTSTNLPTLPISGRSTGLAVNTGQDFDNDGWPDIAFGVPGTNFDLGEAYIYSARDGRLLWTIKPPSGWTGRRFGASIDMIPDLDGDGVVDVIVGCALSPTTPKYWEFRVLSGKTRGLLFLLADSPRMFYGISVLGDLTGDGYPEIAVYRDDGIYIYDMKLVGGYGKGCASTVDIPVLNNGLPTMIGRPFHFKVTNVGLRAAGFLTLGLSDSVWGTARLPLDLAPLGMPGCQMLCSWDVAIPFRPPSSQGSQVIWNGQLPNDPLLTGRQVFAQVWFQDPAANSLGIATSNGLRLVIRGN